MGRNGRRVASLDRMSGSSRTLCRFGRSTGELKVESVCLLKFYVLATLKRVTNVWDSLPRYIVENSSMEVQDIAYNYEVALSLGHSDWAGNDIFPGTSDNDLDIQV